MQRTRLGAFLALFFALVLVTGCGSGNSNGSDGGSDGDSGGGDTSAPTEELTNKNFGSTISEAMKDAGTFHITMTSSAAGQESKGEGDADLGGDEPAVRMKLSVGSEGDVESLVVDGFYYLKGGMFAPDGKWLKIDPNAKDGLGAMIGQIGGGANPTEMFELMNESATVTKVGEEKIDGVDTYKYDVSVPRDELIKARGLPQEMASMLPEQIAYTMWIDGENRVRRTDQDMAVGGTSAKSSMLFSKFGDDVEISAPSEEDTTTEAPSIPGMPTN